MLHAWYARELLRRLADGGISFPPAPLTSIQGVDITMEKLSDELTAIFVKTWGKGHGTHCRSPATCTCYILDGHMKCRRIICANKLARVVEAGDLGTFVLPCAGQGERVTS